MGARIQFKIDNYFFEKFGMSRPSAMSRIDESGKEIPLTMEEVIEVTEKYYPSSAIVSNTEDIKKSRFNAILKGIQRLLDSLKRTLLKR